MMSDRYKFANSATFFGNMVEVQIVPFALPYHALSYDLLNVIPLLQEVSKDPKSPDPVKGCPIKLLEDYQDYCWSNI